MNIFTQLFSKAQSNPAELKQRIRQDLLRREARVGKLVFGPIPKGHTREFFRIDAKTWIWQESWMENGKRVSRETKYVVRARDVIKSINGSAYQKTTIAEAKNLEAAIKTYVARVKKDVYNV